MSLSRRKSCKNFNKIRILWESKSHEDFIHQINLESSFIDYFLIIGIDPKICMNNYLYTTSPKDLDENYSKDIYPEILTKYPPIKKSYINMDDSIISLCFPNGFHLKEYDYRPNRTYLKFLLDNNFFSTEHPHKYITCLLFYESLFNYYKLKKQIQKELENEGEEILKVFNSCSIKNEGEINTKNIERFYFPKVICLISIEPFYKEHELILKQIYQYFLYNKQSLTVPLEKIILNIIKTIPIPPMGIMEIKYKLNKNFNDIIIRRNQRNKINNVDEYIDYMFSIFTIDECLDIFKYTLLEVKTIVFSKNINNLCKFIYGLINILFPFQYPFQVSSCLPIGALSFLESISPYIFGINQNYSENIIKKNLISHNVNILIIDLDNKKIIEKMHEKFPELPKFLRKKVKDKIKKKFRKTSYDCTKNREEEQKNELDSQDLYKKSISYIFFNSFFINLMINYSNFINTNDLKNKNKILTIKNLFKLNDFVNSHLIVDIKFFKKFVETQMFTDFIYKKMIPKNIDEKMEILLFDECIIRKKNKMKLTKNTPFLKSKEYEHTQTFKIPETEPLTDEEKYKFENREYILDNLLKGQYIKKKESIINNINNNIIKDNEDIIINYFVFPKFNEDYFEDTKSEYFSFSSLKEDIHYTNTDVLSKSENINFKEIENKSMLNYIYLTYIELWGYSFWYHENTEKKYKFRQLLNIIDKINNHEIELYNLLFESLNKNNDEDKILELYDKLFSHKISPSSYIYSLIDKIKKNKKENNIKTNDKFPNKIRKLFSFRKNSSNKSENINKIIYNFKLRTFRCDNELNLFGDKVYFETIQKCSGCRRNVNIYNLCINNKNMINNGLWAQCPYCKVYFVIFLIVHFGNIYHNEKITKSVLLSPYELKINIKNLFTNKKDQELDIDNFKNNYPDLFWCSIWYFYIYKIDFSFFLPYEKNINKFIKNILVLSNIESNIINNNNNNNIKNISNIKIKKSKKLIKNKNNNLIIHNTISINFISNS